MPVYEYRCKTCKDTVEISMTVKERAEHNGIACPECGGKELVRLFSSFAVGSSQAGSVKSSYSNGNGGCCGSGSCGCA